MKQKIIHKGQVALVMVLIMTVVSAVVVSVAGRATTETRNQQMSQESADAFLTAQSGLEEAISKGTGVTGSSTDKSFVVTLENNGQSGLVVDKVVAGTSVDVVLNASLLLQGVKIYWNSLTPSTSSILISKISSNLIEDVAYDTTGSNGFVRVSTGGVLNGANFSYVTPQISLNSSVERLRITVYGSAVNLGIEPVGDTLPVQTVSYRSEAAVGSGDQKVKYGLLYEQSKDQRTPEVFDYALFSYGTIIQ